MKQIFVNIKEGGLRKNIREVTNIDFMLSSELKSRMRGKPGSGGLWTTNDGTTWIELCIKSKYREKFPRHGEWELYELEVLETTKLLVIDSAKDNEEKLRENYTLEDNGSYHFLDWEKIKQDFDGVQFTEKGQRETALHLYGWEILQILWFRWSFKSLWVTWKVAFKD